MRRGRLSLTALATAILVGALLAHVRLIHSGNGRMLTWPVPSNISIAISSQGSDDIADSSDLTAIQNSIAAWNASTLTSARLIEDQSPATRARTDWAADDLHLVYFDETAACGYFPTGSGIVAITPVWFTSGGRITDADILFNGKSYGFTTKRQPGAFDVQDVATHELGHLLGLDHSGCVGASLYPYVSTGNTLHRSISSDDEHGLRDAYPAGSTGMISGTVRRASDATAVSGAYVVVRSSAGRTIASALADAGGAFQIRGLSPDTYDIYATPLDFPVSNANLTPGRSVQVDFRSTMGTAIVVAAGASVASADLLVGADSSLSLGRNFDPLPLGAQRGRTSVLSLHGSGLAPGSTLSSGDPTITIAALAWTGNQVIFSVTVPAGAAPGHVDLIATSAPGELSILPGAIEVVPLTPIVAFVVPNSASDAGGTLLTITGRNFRSGLRLLIGENIYEDGALGGCTVIDAETITLNTQATPGGNYDVVVIDSTGVEGRLSGGFEFTSIPTVAGLFPPAGATLGGTRVTLTGGGFVAGSSVRIDGVNQVDVDVHSSSRLEFTTEPGLPGGPYLVEVENPGGAVATAAFSYAASVDPSLTSIDPASASTQGAVLTTLHGDGFTPDTNVVFGVDPITGSGGVSASDVTFIDAQTLEVLVPAHAGGEVALMVSEPSTGQAGVLPSSFTYTQDGGGGGGCSAVVNVNRPNLRGMLEGGWWLLAALVFALSSMRRPRIVARRV